MRNILFFFSNTLIGGAETNILKISKELNSLGYTVHFASMENNGPLLDHDHVARSFTEIGNYNKTPGKSFFKYKKLIIDNNIDIVSAFGLRVELFVRFFSKKIKPDIKVVSNIRASETWRKPIHSFLDMITSNKVDAWASNSISAAKTFIEREKIDKNKVSIIYNFIELEKDVHQFHYDDLDVLKIGVLANYKRSKGHFNLIDIAKQLIAKNINFKIYCAGHDYTNGQFEKNILSEGLSDTIILLGHISNKKQFFESIDVFFLPSYIEGLPTSMIEAMASGIPVVASNVDGIPEAINNEENGLITDPNNIDTFVNYLIRIRSKELREKYSKKSFDMLRENFDKDKNMTKWDRLFKTLD